jgi:hypothetical protein
MYTIVSVIYGVPLNSNDSDIDGGQWKKHSAKLNNMLDDGEPFFLRYYSGARRQFWSAPSAFGVKLDSFDECCHHTELEKCIVTPTQAQKDELTEAFNRLPKAIQKEIKSNGEMRVFLLWSTS